MIPDDVSDWQEFLKELGCSNIIVYDDWAMCECVFHNQTDRNRPSLGINKETGVCHCFSCGYHDWDDFCNEMDISSDSYQEKVSHKQWESFKNRLLKGKQISYRRYHLPVLDCRDLTEDTKLAKLCRKYFAERAINVEYAKRFGIKAFNSKGEFYKYDQSIIFPIFDEKDVLYFQSRYVGNDSSKPRWNQPINSPVWKTYWEFEDAKSWPYSVLTEGIPDSLKLRQLGVNAIPAKTFSIYQLKKIFRTKWEYIYLLYDQDEGGRNFDDKAMSLLTNCGKIVQKLSLPDNIKDPALLTDIDSLIETNREVLHDTSLKFFHNRSFL